MAKGLPWLRLYTSVLTSAKVQTLPTKHFRGWINLLCVAGEGDGVLPPLHEIAFKLRLSALETTSLLDSLVSAQLLDKDEDGYLMPHDWDEHQYVSDNSTPRVKKHRLKRARNVSVTPSEQSRTEQIQKQNRGEQSAEAAKPPEAPAAKPQLVREMPNFEATDGDLIVERILNVCMPKHPVAGGRNLARDEVAKKLRVAPSPADLAVQIINAHEQFREYWKVHPPDARRLFAWWIRDEDYLSPPQAVLSPVLSKTDQALKALWPQGRPAT